MLKIFLLFPLLIGINCKKNYKQYFQPSLSPVEVYEKPDVKSGRVFELKHNESIYALLDEKSNKPRGFPSPDMQLSFAQIRLGPDKLGYVGTKWLSETKNNYYYQVVTTNGLNLRDKPGMDGKIITVIPHKHIDEINGQIGNLTSLQEKNGYWLNVSFGKLNGYVFSGFVKIAGNKKDLDEYVLNYTFDELPETEFNFDDPKIKISKKVSLLQYELFEVSLSVDPGDCFAKKAIVVFKNMRTKKTYVSNDFYAETLSGNDSFFGNAYNSNFDLCICCCGGGGENTFFFTDTKVIRVHTKFRPSRPVCYLEEQIGVTWTQYREIRRDETGNIFVHVQQPDCEYPNFQPNRDGKVRKIENPKIAASLFIKISSDFSGFSAEIYKNEDVPTPYKDKWPIYQTLK